MTGSELAALRRRLGFSQLELMRELDVRSRQTVSSWENSDEAPRIVVLALHALELDQDCRIMFGKKCSQKEEHQYYDRLKEKEMRRNE